MKQYSRGRFSSCATWLLLTIALTSFPVWSQTSVEPIIDMHLHAKHADELGPPPTLSLRSFFDMAGQGHS